MTDPNPNPLLDDLAEVEALAKAATPGEWELWSGCSWRRFGVKGTGHQTVCEPITQRDGHPDLHFRNGGQEGPDAQWIAFANPARLLRIVAAVRELEADAERWRAFVKLAMPEEWDGLVIGWNRGSCRYEINKCNVSDAIRVVGYGDTVDEALHKALEESAE